MTAGPVRACAGWSGRDVAAIQHEMSVRHEGLVALREKYREIHRLRREQAAGHPKDPKLDMRALAARFPGALREVDELDMTEIKARMDALDAALEAGAEAPTWALLQLRYHGWLRIALRLKLLWSRPGGPKRAPSEPEARALLRALWEAHRSGPEEPEAADVEVSHVIQMVRPPDGRLNAWVYARVGTEHGCASEAVRDALFPPRPMGSCRDAAM
jgi:hypothetical protein